MAIVLNMLVALVPLALLRALIDNQGNLVKDQSMANAVAVGGAFLLVIGAVAAYGGVSGFRKAARTRRTGIRYTGQVVAQDWSRGGENSLAFRRVRWVDRDGIAREALTKTGNTAGSLRPMPYPIEIDVDPNEPDRFEVAHGLQSGIGTGLLFFVAGIPFVVVGVFMIRWGLFG